MVKSKKKVLFINQEIYPYLPETELSKKGRELPQGIQEKGREIRTFMPKYGKINERRNQLHEVIRLSGMNLVINDNDYPLIIKVASIQAARMQVYFIDNEDYFQRKFITLDKNGEDFKDNDERSIFFVRGVIETVKKLRWTPDIIHCNGWFSALATLYVKKAFSDDPCFKDAKVVYSLYDNEFKTPFKSDFANKLRLDGITDDDIKDIQGEVTFKDLNELAFKFSDGIIQASENIDEDVIKAAKESGKPFLEYKNDEEYIASVNDFYDLITK